MGFHAVDGYWSRLFLRLLHHSCVKPQLNSHTTIFLTRSNEQESESATGSSFSHRADGAILAFNIIGADLIGKQDQKDHIEEDGNETACDEDEGEDEDGNE